MHDKWAREETGTKKQDEKPREQETQRMDNGERRGLAKKYLWNALAFSGNPPHIDARGVAIGLWVALGIPIGGHTVTLGLLRPFIRYNVGLAFAATWIINPLTAIPLYSAYYYVGSLILGEPQALSMEKFRQVLESIVHAQHFWESLRAFIMLDLAVLKRWVITAIMVSVPCGAIGYAITYRIQARRIQRRQKNP